MTEPNVAPLEGIRVIDFTRVLAGPYCTQVLGDLGADVIKIEEAAGDEVRHIPPPYPGGESHYFLSLNRNKRSVVVDLKSPEGRDFALDLIRRADVVIENFRPGVMARLGLGFDVLAAAKPDIVMCSISGYGESGPLSTAPAFDLVIQARAGAMFVNGDPDRPPTKLGLPIGDLAGGLWSTIAILSALRRRDQVREAQHLDIGLLDGVLALQGYLGQLAMLTGTSPGRFGSDHHNVVPYGRFETADGHMVVAVLVPQFWAKLCHAIGRPELIDDPRFATLAGRRDHRNELIALLNEIFRTRTRAEWASVLKAADVPHGPVLDVVEALKQEQVVARGTLTDIRHPTAGEFQVVGSPIRINGVKPTGERRAAPLLGEHTVDVATDLAGLSAEAVDVLLDKGVLGSNRLRAEA